MIPDTEESAGLLDDSTMNLNDLCFGQITH
jgi:hypothetical protein